MTALRRGLAWCALHGSPLLAAGIFGGLLVPPLAHALRWFITPNVMLLMTFLLLRVDLPAAFAHLRHPIRLAAITGFCLLICPLITWTLVRQLPLDAGIAAATVIFATGCSVTSGAAFARMVGLDAELAMLTTLATTLLVPLTAPPLVYALVGVDLAFAPGAFMARLLLVVGVPLLASVALRRAVGARRLTEAGPDIDGLIVVILVLFGFGVMDGLTARLLADPGWVLTATLAGFVADFGLNALTTLAFAPLGWRAAASAGLVAGNRNMALYIAALPAGADPRIGLFFALCQLPIFLSPFLLRPLYRMVTPPAAP